LFIPYISKDQPASVRTVEINVEYFLLDIGHYSSTPTHGIPQDYESSFYIARAAFMVEMWSIKIIHIIINSDDIAYILEEDPWKRIVNGCSELKKIRIEVCGNTSQNKQSLTNKALELQIAVCATRETIKFQISFL
jgi:hypothetical protein